jgi:hypothetical protein
LCPKSCGNCPAQASHVAHGKRFRNPTPERSHGSRPAEDEIEEAAKAAIPDDDGAAADEESVEDQDDAKSDSESDESDSLCTDDVVWTDEDNDGCAVYASYIESGKLSRGEACGYNDGAAKVHCRRTCDTCEPDEAACEDKECISEWKIKFGKCYGCAEYANMCEIDDAVKADCPRTCQTCNADERRTTRAPMKLEISQTTISTTTTTQPVVTAAPKCEDQECVIDWMRKRGKCYQCQEFAEEFCGRDEEFMKSCPKTCKTCSPHEEPVCEDDFKQHVCKRHVTWGWCVHAHVAEHCKASCGLCATAEKAAHDNQLKEGEEEHKSCARRTAHFLLLTTAALFTVIAQNL